MKIIVAADNNWAIGNQGELLVSIPGDHKMFRMETTGKVVVLGRKTLATFPEGRPLKNRTNIIMSRDESLSVKDAIVVHSVEELLEMVKAYDTNDVYIIGGASIYEQMLPYCDTAIVTKINMSYAADAYFPDLDKSEEWNIVSEGEEQTYFDLEYNFVTYKRV